ncbi:hypothetical protein ACFL5Z_05140 [Planctomycetota bacterium]
MIGIRFENPKGTALPRGQEFRTELEELVDRFIETETSYKKHKEVEAPEGAMGEPAVFLLELLAEPEAAIAAAAALTRLIIAVRDLYANYRSKRKKADRTDSLKIEIGDTKLPLPASDDDIEVFVEQRIRISRTTEPHK